MVQTCSLNILMQVMRRHRHLAIYLTTQLHFPLPISLCSPHSLHHICAQQLSSHSRLHWQDWYQINFTTMTRLPYPLIPPPQHESDAENIVSQPSGLYSCKGTWIQWLPGSIWDTYAYAQHELSHVTWQLAQIDEDNNRICLKVKACHKLLESDKERSDGACSVLLFYTHFQCISKIYTFSDISHSISNASVLKVTAYVD